jgi:hypothetical protein
MSPIGRVFIVLNLALAGGFVAFAGTYLQKQHNWKTQYTKEKEAHEATTKKAATDVAKLEGELLTMTGSKNGLERERDSLTLDRNAKVDEIKLLEGRVSSFEGELKKMTSIAEANKVAMEAALSESQKAMQMAIADQKTKDDAVRAKDAAEAENRGLKGQIAALTEDGSNKDVKIAALTKDNSEKQLLIDVAIAKGFHASMAVPQLAGTVSIVSGRLCTVAITDNPTNAEVKPGYTLAIYDASGYKGEARIDSVDAGRNAAFCTLQIHRGEVKVGDKASTHLTGTN